MIVDYSKFELGVHLHGKVVIDEGGHNKEITAQLEPDDNGEIPDVEKKTLEFFLDNYSEYTQFLLEHIFEYYKECRDEWGATEPDTIWKENDPISEHTGTTFRALAKMLSISETALWNDMEITP